MLDVKWSSCMHEILAVTTSHCLQLIANTASLIYVNHGQYTVWMTIKVVNSYTLTPPPPPPADNVFIVTLL